MTGRDDAPRGPLPVLDQASAWALREAVQAEMRRLLRRVENPTLEQIRAAADQAEAACGIRRASA